jgi:hypothetical protein
MDQTPEEWKLERIGQAVDANRFLITAENGARTVVDGRMFESTARQFTALPYLLAACKKLAAWDTSSADSARLISEACSYARAGIVAAEGLTVLDAIKAETRPSGGQV